MLFIRLWAAPNFQVIFRVIEKKGNSAKCEIGTKDLLIIAAPSATITAIRNFKHSPPQIWFMRRVLPKATFLNLSEWLLKIKKGCCLK